MRRSFDALKFCLELFRGFWPLAAVKVDAWAVEVPPPMINAPGLFRFPPFRKSRLSGNGSLGTASWSAQARAHPNVAVFTRVAEEKCVFCPLGVYRGVEWLWAITGFCCGAGRVPLSAVEPGRMGLFAGKVLSPRVSP